MRIRSIRAELEPILGLVVSLDTGGKTLVTGIFDDTVISEITDTGIEGTLVVSAVHIDIVLLTEGRLIGRIPPVVRLEIVGNTVGTLITASQGGIRIQFSIHADQVLALRNGIHIVTKEADQVLVGLDIRIGRRIAARNEVVVQLSIETLVVFTRLCRHPISYPR